MSGDSGALDEPVCGRLYGSTFLLALVLVPAGVALGCVLVPVGVLAWLDVVSIALGMTVLAAWMARGWRVCVSAEGIVSTPLIGGTEVSISWDDVQYIEKKTFSASVVLKVPYKLVRYGRSSKRVYFAMCDGDWESRDVSKAILGRWSTFTP